VVAIVWNTGRDHVERPVAIVWNRWSRSAGFSGRDHLECAESLKSASYEAHFGGRFIFWDEHGIKQDAVVRRGDKCVLRANSIAFVQVEPQFRLPNYIALRFNLRITHVHRGLLLGTGPLVDPGFVGQLLIPLHNLTATDYEIDTADALIWIEFTKTTFRVIPEEEEASPERQFRGFPDDKKDLKPETYLHKANRGNPIRSSIPDIVQRSKQEAETAAQSARDAEALAQNAEQSAKAAKDSVATTRNIFLGIGFAGLGAIVVALVAIVLQGLSLVQDSKSLATSVTQSVASMTTEFSTARADAIELGRKVNEVEPNVMELRNDASSTRAAIAALVQRLDALEKQIGELKSISAPKPSQE